MWTEIGAAWRLEVALCVGVGVGVGIVGNLPLQVAWLGYTRHVRLT